MVPEVRMKWFPLMVCVAGCDLGSLTESITSSIVGTTVEVGKGVVEGAQSGVSEGRGAQSIDGANVLTTTEAIRDALDFEVVDVGPTAAGPNVTIALVNDTDALVRIGRLDEHQNTLAIDVDGFAFPLVGSPGHLLGDAIDVPAHSKVKVTLAFEAGERAIGVVRIAGEDIPVP